MSQHLTQYLIGNCLQIAMDEENCIEGSTLTMCDYHIMQCSLVAESELRKDNLQYHKRLIYN